MVLRNSAFQIPMQLLRQVQQSSSGNINIDIVRHVSGTDTYIPGTRYGITYPDYLLFRTFSKAVLLILIYCYASILLL